MDHLLDDEDDIAARGQRELTLSTGAILGLFFALVVSWGLFFGLGFNMGSHRTPAPIEDATADASSTHSSANFNAFKPAAGSPTGSAPVQAQPSDAGSAPIVVPPSQSHAATPANTESPATHDDTQPEPTPAGRNNPLTLSHPAVQPAQVTPAPPVAVGSFIVQVAAVSHQEDADLLVTALRSKGYAVAARAEPQDKLLHIQVGPFTNKKDADTMRQRLLADGYNAIIK
jgi:cell division septation protein DedD